MCSSTERHLKFKPGRVRKNARAREREIAARKTRRAFLPGVERRFRLGGRRRINERGLIERDMRKSTRVSTDGAPDVRLSQLAREDAHEARVFRPH